MDGMIFVSSSGAEQMLHAQAVHANNLANVNTTGFRADRIQFATVPVTTGGLETKAFAYAFEPATNYEPGGIVPTSRELDVAVQGDGWLTVEAKDGKEAYTRNGNLNVSVEGILLTAEGLPVVGNGGQITIPPNHKIDIAPDGTITIMPLTGSNNQPVVLDRLKLVKPEHANLFKGTDGLFRLKEGLADADSTVRVASGYLEGSNVNPVESLTHMISIARQYEMQMRMMSFAHENDQSTQEILTLA